MSHFEQDTPATAGQFRSGPASNTMTRLNKEKYGVLVVDDSEDDRHFMRLLLRNNPRLKIIGEARDGEEAISYLSGIDAFADRTKFPFPDVVLLDLKMPKRTGFEVLEWVQTQPFKDLVVIVVSGSVLPQDAARSLELGAAAYHDKSAFMGQQEAMFREIEGFLAKS